MKSVDIQSVMTLCPHSVGLDQDLEVARKMMKKFNIHHLPVQEGGKLVGIISDRDIKFATGWAKDKKDSFLVSDVYIPEPYVVAPTVKLEEVLKRLMEDKIGCALVAVDNSKLVGIFTTTDACRLVIDEIKKG